MARYAVLILLAVTLVQAYSSGPPDGKTGRPGEGTCSDCHSGPSGSADSTALVGLIGNSYHPDSVYNLALSVQFVGQTRWGFELTAVDRAGQRAGFLSVSDPTNTQLSPAGPGYMKQTLVGTHAGTSGPVSWNFRWQAPSAGAGPVTFYWCANAANNNGSGTGDAICRDSLQVAEASGVAERPPAARRVFWRFANPGRSTVVIDYHGRADQPVRIYSASGCLVRLVSPTANGEMLRVVWDGRNLKGQPVPPAGYFVRLGSGIDAVIRVQVVR